VQVQRRNKHRSDVRKNDLGTLIELKKKFSLHSEDEKDVTNQYKPVVQQNRWRYIRDFVYTQGFFRKRAFQVILGRSGKGGG